MRTGRTEPAAADCGAASGRVCVAEPGRPRPGRPPGQPRDPFRGRPRRFENRPALRRIPLALQRSPRPGSGGPRSRGQTDRVEMVAFSAVLQGRLDGSAPVCRGVRCCFPESSPPIPECAVKPEFPENQSELMLWTTRIAVRRCPQALSRGAAR